MPNDLSVVDARDDDPALFLADLAYLARVGLLAIEEDADVDELRVTLTTRGRAVCASREERSACLGS